MENAFRKAPGQSSAYFDYKQSEKLLGNVKFDNSVHADLRKKSNTPLQKRLLTLAPPA